MFRYHQNKQGFVSYCRDTVSIFRDRSVCSLVYRVRRFPMRSESCLVSYREIEKERHIAVLKKPATSSCLFTLSHRNSTIIMVLIINLLEILQSSVDLCFKQILDKCHLRLNQEQVFSYIFDCLTGYASVLDALKKCRKNSNSTILQ